MGGIMTNNRNSVFVSGGRVPHAGKMGLAVTCTLIALLATIWVLALATPAAAEGPLLVISIASGTNQPICDTDDPGDCIQAAEQDLILCKPTSTGPGGEINGCDWELFLEGADDTSSDEIDKQLRALEIARNGNLAFVVGGNDFVQGLPNNLSDNDVTVFNPADILQPYLGGGPYKTGAAAGGIFKLYLDGLLSQDELLTAKPWDAVEILPDGSCEDNITAVGFGDHSCTIIGSLTSGNADELKFGGIKFANEDLIRCIPTGFAGNGAVADCDYSVFLDASGILPEGFTSDIEAIDFLSFDPSTLYGRMVFQMKSGDPAGFPPHEPGRDLLLYEGRFGSGLCVPSGNPCAGDADCPGGETCNTGTCNLGGSCSTDQDCGTGDYCIHTVPYSPDSVTLFFDGSEAGLDTLGKNIEAFSIVPDDDGDIIPDGLDNCPDAENPPSICSDPEQTSCPSGLSSECPEGFVCTQADSDGDGAGDPCDQCNGRDDAVCYCGDFILDVPSEECDLGDPLYGGSNGEPGSPCTSDCSVLGFCTGTAAAACSSVGDCPTGEGCCGDGQEDGPEECDDGNRVPDDGCDDCKAVTSAQDNVPIVGCDDGGGTPLPAPNIIPAYVKVAKFRNTRNYPDFDRWQTKGEFIFQQGLLIEPENQPTTIIFNQLVGELFSSTLQPGYPGFELFVDKPTVKKWKFKDKEADIPGSPSWRKGKFIQKGTEIKYVLDGRNVTLFDLATVGDGLPPDPDPIRQTVRVGDVCFTKVLTCEVKGGGKTLKCK